MFKFPSLEHPEKYGFLWDRGAYSSSCRYPQVDEHCQFFETYGDGMTQHSPEIPIPYEMAADYFASLAAYLLDNPEHVNDVSYVFAKDYGDKDLAFAQSVVYKAPPEGKYAKPRYFSVQERKFGGEAKQYDKRYTRIEEWMDGGPEAIVRILGKDHYDPLDWFILRHQVREWMFKQDGWMEVPKIGKDVNHDVAREQVQAYETLTRVMEHVRGMECARRSVECWKGNLERAKQRAAEKTDAA